MVVVVVVVAPLPNHRTAGALWALTARASIRDRGLSRKELAVTGRKVTVSGCGCGDVAVMRRNFYWSGETWARALTVPLRTRLLCTSPGLLLPHSAPLVPPDSRRLDVATTAERNPCKQDKLVLEGRKLGNREAVCSARARQRLACCAQSPQADFVIKEQRATASGTSGT